MGSAFTGTMMGVNLLGALFSGNGNSSTTLLKNSQPAFAAAQQMQQQSTNMSVQEQQQQAMAVMTDAATQAQQSANDSKQQIGEQAMAYNSSGVQLEGSPMVVLERSRQLAQQSVNAIMARGAAQSNMLLSNAAITANQGRASLLGATNAYTTNLAQSKIAGSQTQASGIQAAIAALAGLGSGIKSPIGNNNANNPFGNMSDPNNPLNQLPPGMGP